MPAFVCGGFLPASQKGKWFTAGIAHIIDCMTTNANVDSLSKEFANHYLTIYHYYLGYHTFGNLAGANISSDAATAPAPVESLDLWPWLSGAVTTSPRNEVVYDHRIRINGTGRPDYAVGALRVGQWKLMIGGENQASW